MLRSLRLRRRKSRAEREYLAPSTSTIKRRLAKQLRRIRPTRHNSLWEYEDACRQVSRFLLDKFRRREVPKWLRDSTESCVDGGPSDWSLHGTQREKLAFDCDPDGESDHKTDDETAAPEAQSRRG